LKNDTASFGESSEIVRCKLLLVVLVKVQIVWDMKLFHLVSGSKLQGSGLLRKVSNCFAFDTAPYPRMWDLVQAGDLVLEKGTCCSETVVTTSWKSIMSLKTQIKMNFLM